MQMQAGLDEENATYKFSLAESIGSNKQTCKIY